MPVRLCLEPACPNPAVYRGRCREHNRVAARSVSRAGYYVYRSKRWQRTRERVLFEQPLCVCGAISEHVHHKQELAAGGDPWARENLEALCSPCHGRITRQEQLA